MHRGWPLRLAASKSRGHSAPGHSSSKMPSPLTTQESEGHCSGVRGGAQGKMIRCERGGREVGWEVRMMRREHFRMEGEVASADLGGQQWPGQVLADVQPNGCR